MSRPAGYGWTRFHPHWADCDHPGALLRACVLNTVRDELRRLATLPLTVPTDDIDELAQVPAQGLPGLRPPAAAGGSWDAWASWDPPLASAIAALKAEDREVLVLDTELNTGERTVAETAQILGITRAAAQMRLIRARGRLRRLLPDGYLRERTQRLRNPRGLNERPAP